jgi:hypothetical protein
VADIKHPRPVLLFLAAFGRREESLQWARRQAEVEFGPLALESESFCFAETEYYAATMGTPLIKRFFAFERLIDPGRLAQIKCLTNAWERRCAVEQASCPPTGESSTLPGEAGDARSPGRLEAYPTRPLNLDPGYLELGKLVLASTKDHAHRIYLGAGIYAEVTLQFRLKAGWQPQPWTFPDYQRADYHVFFDRCREYLHRRLREETPEVSGG